MLSKQNKEDLINSITIFEENLSENIVYSYDDITANKDILYNTIQRFNTIVAKYVSQYELSKDMMVLLIEQQRWALGRARSNKEVAEIMTRVLNFIDNN
jgi:hypothetical protein